MIGAAESLRDLNPPVDPAPGPASVAALEGLLSQWFGKEAILTSSGRAAMLLWLDVLGLNRYRHRVATTRMISGCVLDVIVRRAFPVDAAGDCDADALVLYHQYGLRQQAEPAQKRILDDICHRFFADARSGARDWRGEAAVFSLPKFFGAQSMIGGLATGDAALAQALRARRDAFEPPAAPLRREQAATFRSGVGGAALETAYLQRLLNPRLHDDELGGAPASLQAICAAGAARAEVLEAWLGALPADLAQESRNLLGADLPYALPLLAPADGEDRLRAALVRHGVPSAIYAIDVARNITAPVYRRGFLLPCHHGVRPEAAAALAREIGDT